MDPQATLDSILTATSHEEFFAGMESLYNWLAKGGFPPKVKLGLTEGRKRIATTSVHSHSVYYAIQTVDPNNQFGWEFVRYASDRVKSFKLLG